MWWSMQVLVRVSKFKCDNETMNRMNSDEDEIRICRREQRFMKEFSKNRKFWNHKMEY